jgi:hypothetical protein
VLMGEILLAQDIGVPHRPDEASRLTRLTGAASRLYL